MKENLQKELLEKVKPGTKPSDIRKLKRSKSAGDIPSAPPLPNSTPLARSKSTEPFKDPKYPYTTLISQAQELEELKNSLSSLDKERQDLRKETETKSTTISLLRKKISELEASNPPNLLLSEQLTEKQKEVEKYRKALEEIRTEVNNYKNERETLLDDNLTLKHQNLKD